MLLGFTAYILIPIYTILFVQGSNLLTTNFSVIGNRIGRQEEFVLWGLIVGIYFFGSLRLIITRMPSMPGYTWLAPLALVFFAWPASCAFRYSCFLLQGSSAAHWKSSLPLPLP